MPEDWEILDDETKALIAEVVRPKKMTPEQALRSADPLGNLNNALPGQTKAQKRFRLLFAAILEVNSVGVSVLFERFSPKETAAIREGYVALGAT
jgi:hypothetical protein